VDFPGMARRVFGDPGRARRRTPACTGAVAVRDAAAAVADTENLKTALGAVKAEEGFMTAASPGVISLFFRDEHYGSHEKYLAAIAEAMRHEYEAVARAGLILQIDCPDLAMGRHIQYAQLSVEEFRKMARLHIEALNHALANVPPDQARVHLCWGNYEGRTITTSRWPTSSTWCSRRSPPGSRSKPPTPATPTSGRSSNA